jgi:hypothetical protein
MPGQAPNWYCTRCALAFYDSTDSKPCPRCHADDALEEQAAPAAKAAPVAAPTKTKATTPSGGAGLLGLGALAIGIPLWLEGARTTRDGWVLFLNWVLDRLGAPYTIPSSALWPWWAAIGALALLGVAYSHIEVKQVPLRIFPWRASRTWQVWVVWVVFIVSDVGTMYLGARSPRPNDPAILHQIAGAVLSAAVYAILITFVPERLVIFGWRKLRG